MSDQPSLTKEQIEDIIKNVVISFDVHDNAVILSAYRLISYFMKDVQDIEKVLRVDINKDKELVVYATAKPKNQFIKSLTIKAVLKNDILSMLRTRYELIKDKDDVYIKVYLGGNTPATGHVEDIDF
jgi:CCR4-NOT transcriptional regulation complex NOT5 subunit